MVWQLPEKGTSNGLTLHQQLVSCNLYIAEGRQKHTGWTYTQLDPSITLSCLLCWRTSTEHKHLHTTLSVHLYWRIKSTTLVLEEHVIVMSLICADKMSEPHKKYMFGLYFTSKRQRKFYLKIVKHILRQ